MAVDTVDQAETTVTVLQQELTEALEEGKKKKKFQDGDTKVYFKSKQICLLCAAVMVGSTKLPLLLPPHLKSMELAQLPITRKLI